MPKKQKKVELNQGSVPDFMKGDSGKGLPDEDIFSLPWTGEDGEADYRKLMAEELGSNWALKVLLWEVIETNTGKDDLSTKQRRLERALNELAGVPIKRGRKAEPEDDALLTEMAKEYYLEAFHYVDTDRFPTEICRQVSEKSPAYRKLKSTDSKAKFVKRLVRKFNERKDILLVSVSIKDELEIMRRDHLLGHAREALIALGVISRI